MYAKYAALRDKRGFNDLKVSEATGIPSSTIYDWRQRSAENAKAGLSADKLLKIAELLGVSVEYFLKDAEKEDA